MKHHLNVLIIALRIALFGVVVYTAFTIASLIAMVNDPNAKDEYFEGTFSSLSINHNTIEVSIIFISLHIILVAYLSLNIFRLYKCFTTIEKGLFLKDQGLSFKRAGAGIIIFAKLKYLLYCAMGSVFFFDITIYFRQFLPFLGIYLIGKLVLVFSYMAETGETLKEETELTI